MSVFLIEGEVVATDIKSEIAAILQEEGLTGISWMTIMPGSGVKTGAAGLSHGPTATLFDPAMQVHVGSVTKTVLATGVLRLVTEGKIDLDAPIRSYLPDLILDNPWQATDLVTTRHLLDHTAGIEDSRFWQVFSEKAAADTALVNALPETGLRVRTRPGTRFSYSNTGYTLAAMIIEATTGQRYESYLDENLLLPLGMHDSSFAYTSQTGLQANPDLVWGHFDGEVPAPAASIYVRPSGQFTTTAADLAKLANFLLSDGEGFIRPDLMHARGRPYKTGASRHGLPAGYSLGLAKRDRHGSIGLCHTGSIIGFYAIFCIFPEEQKAFAYSVNTDSESADYSRITALIMAHLALEKAPVADQAPLPELAEKLTGFYRISPTRFDLFHYIDTVFGMRWLKQDAANQGLVWGGLQTKDRLLLPAAGGLYRATDRSSASHVFYENSDGVTILDEGFMSYQKVSFLFVWMHFSIIGLGLVGACILLVAGLLALLRRDMKAPVIYALLGLVFLTVPIPFFFAQSFMALGDLTTASALLAISTAALPFFMLLTIYKTIKSKSSFSTSITRWSAVFVFLWWGAMMFYGQMPLILWS